MEAQEVQVSQDSLVHPAKMALQVTQGLQEYEDLKVNWVLQDLQGPRDRMEDQVPQEHQVPQVNQVFQVK